MFLQLHEILEELRSFIETGGDVLYIIFLVAFAMWSLILERLWYFKLVHKNEVKQLKDIWKNYEGKTSWETKQICYMHASRVSRKLFRSLSLIKTFMALCPLLGLLGTVTGMIEVFDIMSMVGGSNVRAMASGVSMATIPTMAGMVAALSGLYFASRLNQTAQNKSRQLEEQFSLRLE